MNLIKDSPGPVIVVRFIVIERKKKQLFNETTTSVNENHAWEHPQNFQHAPLKKKLA